jgi:hypothetical protein
MDELLRTALEIRILVSVAARTINVMADQSNGGEHT